MKLFVNGRLEQVCDVLEGPLRDDGPREIRIGHRPGPPWNTYLNGLIDEVRIYNRALSAEEIKANYEVGRIRFAKE